MDFGDDQFGVNGHFVSSDFPQDESEGLLYGTQPFEGGYDDAERENMAMTPNIASQFSGQLEQQQQQRNNNYFGGFCDSVENGQQMFSREPGRDQRPETPTGPTNLDKIGLAAKETQDVVADLKRLEQENLLAGETLAKLEALAASEREELSELMLACFELQSSIDNVPFCDELEQKYSMIDSEIEAFTRYINELEKRTQHLHDSSGMITASIDEAALSVTSNEARCEEYLEQKKEIMQTFSSKLSELAVAKKTTASRYAAEIKEIDSDIESLRPLVNDAEGSVNEYRNCLETLKKTLAQADVERDQVVKARSDAIQQYQDIQTKVQELQEHDPEMVKNLLDEIKLEDEKTASFQAAIEKIRSGKTTEHDEYETYKSRVNECRSARAVTKERIMNHQREAEKDLVSRMAQLRDLNRQLADTMDALNCVRQKSYSERLDFEYMFSKSELDFEKIAASGEERLRELAAIMNDLKRQVNENCELESHAEEMRRAKS